MATITLQPAQTVDIDLDNLNVNFIRDNSNNFTIIANIQGLPRPVLLWSGEEEYAAAGVWTNESALARAKEILSSDSPRFS